MKKKLISALKKVISSADELPKKGSAWDLVDFYPEITEYDVDLIYEGKKATRLEPEEKPEVHITIKEFSVDKMEGEDINWEAIQPGDNVLVNFPNTIEIDGYRGTIHSKYEFKVNNVRIEEDKVDITIKDRVKLEEVDEILGY